LRREAPFHLPPDHIENRLRLSVTKDRNNVTKSKVKTVEKARHLLIVEPSICTMASPNQFG